MYYDKQPQEEQENYKKMLSLVGSLSRLFGVAAEPYLPYRAQENIFSKYFDMENNARSDDSADAYNSAIGIGIGLKTWVGQDNQKVAEFGKLRPQYEGLKGIELVKAIAGFRNERIRTTKKMHGLHALLYHVVKREPGMMCIYEVAFDEIDIDHIKLLPRKGSGGNNIYFCDGKHTYHFSLSKNTLYMLFDDMTLLDKFKVEIYDDPYEVLAQLGGEDVIPGSTKDQVKYEQLCLRLYSSRSDGRKFVGQKSGLNQWNAGGRARNADELYIPYPVVDRERKVDFFPSRDVPFELRLPDGTWIDAKVCQDGGKAIMSNPNSLLGKWLLRDVFNLPEHTLLTYDMLVRFNVDSVIFTKYSELRYKVDFCPVGTYEQFYAIEDEAE